MEVRSPGPPLGLAISHRPPRYSSCGQGRGSWGGGLELLGEAPLCRPHAQLSRAEPPGEAPGHSQACMRTHTQQVTCTHMCTHHTQARLCPRTCAHRRVHGQTQTPLYTSQLPWRNAGSLDPSYGDKDQPLGVWPPPACREERVLRDRLGSRQQHLPGLWGTLPLVPHPARSPTQPRRGWLRGWLLGWLLGLF